MKVNNSSGNPATSSIRGKEVEGDLKTKNKSALSSSTPEELLDSSKVNMSPDAQMFSKAKAIASKDTIDEAKVARLQKLIDQGKYKVDAEAIADRLVDEHLATGD